MCITGQKTPSILPTTSAETLINTGFFLPDRFLQYGGPDGEIGASLRYLSQRYAMPYDECKAALTDIGTEELAHMEIVAAIVHQLTRNLTPEQIVESGFGPYYIDHTTGIWPQSAGGVPFSACAFQSKGDPITDLFENMAAEQKARTTYDNILRVVKDPDVCDPIRYLRVREIIHFQRFGEALRITQDKLNSKNFYAFNPAFDRPGSQEQKPLPNMPQQPQIPIQPTVPTNQATGQTVAQQNQAPAADRSDYSRNMQMPGC